MNKKTIYGVKNIVIMIVFITMSLRASAQTELTTEMVWQEGTHWIYPYKMWRGFPPENHYIRECRLVKYIDEKTNEEYLSVECMDTRVDGSWSNEWYPFNQYLKVEGDKVSASLLDEQVPQYKDYLYQLYDFSTWNEGETIYFEMVGYRNAPEKTSVTVENLQRIVADPEGKYYTYAFSGKDTNSNPFYYVKGIGRVQDYDIASLVYHYVTRLCGNEVPGDPGGSMALKVWHPDLGVLYQHPDYEHVMELAGAYSLTADESEEAIVKAGAGEVTVESAQPVEVMICTTTGVTVRRDRVIGSATYPLAPGIYIVRAGSRTCKICI